MAGGTWTLQNKVRPGVYINVESSGGTLGAAGSRGVAGIALSLPWGAAKVITPIVAGEDTLTRLGYDLTAPELLLVRETLKRARTVLLYKLNEGTKAAVTAGVLTATAKYGGLRGNALRVVVQTNLDDNTKFDVKTLLDGSVVDTQVVSNIAGLVANDWIVWSGTGALTASAGAPLVGGANGAVTNADHTAFLAALELYDFQTVALPSTDNALKAVYAAFIRRLRDAEGKKVQAVLENYPTADNEGVLSVRNGVVLSDGTTLTAAQATAWVAGATAGAEMNESLTYAAYDDAVDVAPRYTNSQIEAALSAGEFIFTPSGGRAVVEQDINTFLSYTPAKNKSFHKNRVIRVLDGIANDLKRIFEASYIGKVSNNVDGRALFRKEIVVYLDALQGIDAIQNFDAQTDITVLPGTDSDAIYVEANIQPVDSIEKVYMKVQVK
ncbi:phage-like element PBSX protein XkdK [Paenibacillus sp. FSL R7-0273]|uniref:phage tail sheath family protein n=1 Tax=Paenibacillus sp. FSL R7-0273 TaxID=1536772 RepID=UPI0004F75D73|nr:phage tail sheath family protein [Paenibacillus sp. FSL R7-0273]AIQ45619.1 phage-like element PBSX protein XkdK [Paenibacillus sp. FSL R7-0273]OMF95138.1 phage tail sheath protein [Paenibacillus sp. FSL R7-0273]